MAEQRIMYIISCNDQQVQHNNFYKQYQMKLLTNDISPICHLANQITPFSRHCSGAQPSQSIRSRKVSTSSLKDLGDIDKLIDDVKIVPLKSNDPQEVIKSIVSSLRILQDLPYIINEVKTIELMLQSIKNKISVNRLIEKRKRYQEETGKKALNTKTQDSLSSCLEDKSKIIYTKFNLGTIERIKTISDTQNINTTVRNKQAEHQNDEKMEQLSQEIRAISQTLTKKRKNSQQIISIVDKRQQISKQNQLIKKSTENLIQNRMHKQNKHSYMV